MSPHLTPPARAHHTPAMRAPQPMPLTLRVMVPLRLKFCAQMKKLEVSLSPSTGRARNGSAPACRSPVGRAFPWGAACRYASTVWIGLERMPRRSSWTVHGERATSEIALLDEAGTKPAPAPLPREGKAGTRKSPNQTQHFKKGVSSLWLVNADQSALFQGAKRPGIR